MNDPTNILDLFFEDPVCGGISDHNRRKFRGILRGLSFKIDKVDRTVFTALNNHDFHARHYCARWVCAVS